MRIDPRWREVCVVAVASALGLVLNRFGVSILPDAGLYFGGIFYLAVALRFGPVAGASAALISSLTLVPHFGWLVVPVVCAEAFTVGAMARRGMQAPLGELLFWAVAGTPFTLLAYMAVLRNPSPVGWVLIVTPPLNGFSNAIVAQLLEVLPGIRGAGSAGSGAGRSIPLRRHLSRHFVSVSALPLLLVTIVSGRFYVERQYSDARDYSSEAAFGIRENIDAVVVRHLSAVQSFAVSLAANGIRRGPRLNGWLASVAAVYPDLKDVIVADSAGTVLGTAEPAATPLQTALGGRLRDRDFFRRTVSEGKPVVSDVTWDSVHAEPVIYLSAPVLSPSGYVDLVVAGSLKISAFQFSHRPERLNRFGTIIVDSAGQVIYAAGDQTPTPLESLEGTPLMASARRAGKRASFRFNEQDAAGVSTAYLAGEDTSLVTGWRIFLKQPFSDVYLQTELHYLIASLCLLAVFALCLPLARLLSVSFLGPLETLLAAFRAFSIDSSRVPKAALPESAPRELAEALEGFEQVAKRLSATYTELQAAIAAREDLNRELQEVLASLDRKIAERTAELAAARDRAEEACRVKGEFLANMSHEIRTPINGILGMLHLLEGSALSAGQRDDLQVAKISAEALLAVINDVLDYSKIEAGRLGVEQMEFSLRQCVEETASIVAHSARAKGLLLNVEMEAGAPDAVVGDRGRLRQVLLNLAGNGIKFTAQGRVTIRVKGVPEGPGAARVAFAVEDTGIGIPGDRRDIIFEPFRQADGSVSRKYGGSGLGLAISSRLIALMGGKLSCESEVGRGSVFHFELVLPLGSAPPPAGPGAQGAEPSTRAEGLNLLLAEDNLVNQMVAVRILRKMGHRVTVASNGIEALERLGAGTYDAIIMDMQMPEMDGLEATREIRRTEAGTGRRIPIVAMTANALAGDRERCIDAGMDGYVSKPIRPDRLAEEIEEVMRRLANGQTATALSC